MIQNNIDSRPQIGNQKTKAPGLIQTRQGVSVLYKDKYLYSKYDPSKSILNIISGISIPEYSIILIFSPVLWYGLKELLSKLPDNSTAAVFEYDENLFDFALKNIPEELKPAFNSKIKIFNRSNIADYYSFIQNNHYRKTLKIEFSAGAAFYKNEYDEISLLTQRVIDQFWKNRLTLIKFGRLYSKNIFKNLSLLSQSVPLASLYQKVDRPIIVLGAGESLDSTIPLLKKKSKSFFIICVDAAFSPLLDNGITPDAVIAVEGQQVIEKAYIGRPADSGVLLIMDLVSRNHIPYITNGNTSFFISEYANINFFNSLAKKELLPPVMPPLGSVGLVAMEIALRLRSSCDIPVYFSGLDFSYTAGITHAKGTSSHKNLLSTNSRLKSVYNLAAAFGGENFQIESKDSTHMITSRILEAYALLFTENFSDIKNVFDAGISGMDLKTEKKNFSEVINSVKEESSKLSFELKKQSGLKEKIFEFLSEEENALEELKDLFTYADSSRFRKKEIPLETQVDELIKNREYLYIHFPDAVGATNPQSFYNRIRIELDFFLKEIATAKSLINER